MRTPGRFLCRLAVLACAFSALAGDAEAAPDSGREVEEQIRELRNETWGWQRLMKVRLSRAPRELAGSSSSRLEFWRAEAERVRRRALNPPRLRAWLCIHRYEGPWNANTGNGYYGGLQMDLAFQRRYAPSLLARKGRAHRWRPIEQIWVAERAHRSGRGFSPWPNTARACGLR